MWIVLQAERELKLLLGDKQGLYFVYLIRGTYAWQKSEEDSLPVVGLMNPCQPHQVSRQRILVNLNFRP